MRDMITDNSNNHDVEMREVNVVLELRMQDAMSADVLDANSDDVLDAVQKHGAEIALGSTISLNTRTSSILLRFDVLAENDAGIYRKVAEVIEIIEAHTDLRFVSSHMALDTGAEPVDGALAAC